MEKIYPKNIEDNMRWRLSMELEIQKDAKVSAMLTRLYEEDILTFFNSALWTYDPRKELKTLPFVTYPFQDDYILWLKEQIENPNDCLTVKSRDMGVSWMMLGVLLWYWLFKPSFSALIGSYIETLVDSAGNLATHFGRIEFLMQNLSPWLRPNYAQTYMKLLNHDNGASIIGSAPTENFSRQGRFNLVWADEFAFWQHARAAWNAMGDSTKCRIVSSTVYGKGTKFSELRNKTKIAKKELHWSLHPEKDDAWFKIEEARRDPEEIAQELEMNENKSIRGRVYPEFSERNYQDKQEYNPTQPLYCTWDFGKSAGNAMAILWIQLDRSTGTARVIDAYQNENKAVDFYIPFITGEIKSLAGIPGYSYSDDEYHQIMKHKKWQPATHYGDPTGGNHDATMGSSYIAELRKAGIIINVNWNEFDLKTRIHKTKLLIRRLEVDKDLFNFIDAMENARYPERAESSQATTPIVAPIHDWTSHFRTALEYFAVNEKLTDRAAKTIEQRQKDYVQKLQKRLTPKKTPSYRPAC